MATDSKINIWVSNLDNIGYIWNVDDAFVLREEHRILGSWVGCPIKPFQSGPKSYGLPLVLMPEEIDCLVRMKPNSIRLLLSSSANRGATDQSDTIKQTKSDEQIVHIYNEFQSESYKDQIKLHRIQRKEEILKMVDKIVEGKKRKLLEEKECDKGAKKKKIAENNKEQKSNANVEVIDLSSSDDNDDSEGLKCQPKEKNVSATEICKPDDLKDGSEANCEGSANILIDREQIIRKEFSKIRDIPPHLALVQTFYEHPWLKQEDKTELPLSEWKYGIESPKEQIRSATFRSLWSRGFYLTAGDKFGADFLAYQGDPTIFHATYVVICYVEDNCQRKIPEKELVAKCRLATCVKKTILISYIDNQRSELESCDSNSRSERIVKYKALRWTAARLSDRNPAGYSLHVSKYDTSEESRNSEAVGGNNPIHVRSDVVNCETKRTQKGDSKEYTEMFQSFSTDNSDSISDVFEELRSLDSGSP